MFGKRTGATKRSGLTVIEVLVALALLGIVSAAIIATFSVMVRVNRDASVDVDFGRTVRSLAEKIQNDWKVTSEWDKGTVGGDLLAVFVDDQSGSRCVGSFAPATLPDGSSFDAVRVVTISCTVGAERSAQVFQFELGSPNL